MRPLRLLSFALLLLAAGGCTPSRHDAAPRAERRWLLSVDNRHWLDVDVFVIHDGHRSRLGPVRAVSAESFLLSPHQLGQLGTIRLQAGAIGASEQVVTEAITVREGQQVEWTLERRLGSSSVAVW